MLDVAVCDEILYKLSGDRHLRFRYNAEYCLPNIKIWRWTDTVVDSREDDEDHNRFRNCPKRLDGQFVCIMPGTDVWSLAVSRT